MARTPLVSIVFTKSWIAGAKCVVSSHCIHPSHNVVYSEFIERWYKADRLFILWRVARVLSSGYDALWTTLVREHIRFLTRHFLARIISCLYIYQISKLHVFIANSDSPRKWTASWVFIPTSNLARYAGSVPLLMTFILRSGFLCIFFYREPVSYILN